MRGEFAARVEQHLNALWEHAAASIPEWLPMRYIDCLPSVYEIAATFSATPQGAARTSTWYCWISPIAAAARSACTSA